MKKAHWIGIVLFALVLANIAVLPLIAGVIVRDTGEIVVRNTATNYTATQVVALITSLGDRDVTLIFDGKRDWVWEEDVTFKTNTKVMIVPGTRIAPSSGVTVSFANVPLESGPWEIFAGDGTISGSGNFLYRYADWGPVKYNVGLGLLGTTNLSSFVRTNASYKMASGTTATLGTMVAGTGTIVRLTTTTNDVTDIVATRSHVAGFNMTPAVNGTVTFTSNMTSSTIQSNIDLVGKYVPFGQARTFAFASGNYTSLYAALNFSGFYGGGEMTVRGDVSGGSDIHSNQATFLDFSTNFAGTAFQVQGNNLRQILVQNLKIKGRQSSFPQTTVFFADTQTAIMRYSYIYSDNTNVGVGLFSRDVGSMQFDRNYIGKHQIGLYGDGSRIYSLSNVTEGASNSDIGTSLVEATYLGMFNDSQPTGTTYYSIQGGSTTN